VSTDRITAAAHGIEGTDSLLSELRSVSRLALPADAIVAVVARGNDSLLNIDAAHESPFPDREEGSDGDLIAELELRRSDGTQFLMIPETARDWLDSRPTFQSHLLETCRTVVDEQGTCRVFALQEPEDKPLDGFGSDGLPVPPPEMVHLTAGLFGVPDLYTRFNALGELGAASIRAMLERNGLAIERFESILDFGCGCGRIMRQWKSLTGTRLHGSDYNPYLVRWCQANIPFAAFTVNGMAPPLAYDDASFDFVYVISIFTHLLEPLQVPWAAEVARVLRPGGVALVTVHGASHLPTLEDPDREAFQAGELIVLRPERAGTNVTAVYHPERYVREQLAPNAGLEVLDFWADGQKDAAQDSFLFRRP
jgi:SAM-dependent methyltransferase